MTREDLERVRAWAGEKLATGDEPPWAWYQYMKLQEALDAILAGMDATRPMGNSPESEVRSGTHLRLVGATCLPDNAPRRPAATPTRMPT